MTKLAAKVITQGNELTIALTSLGKEGVTTDEKMLASKLVKAIAADEMLAPLKGKLWLNTPSDNDKNDNSVAVSETNSTE